MVWTRVTRRLFHRSVPLFLAVSLFAFGCSRAVRLGTPQSTQPGGVPPEQMAELWVDRGDLSTLDLYRGAADPAFAPRPGQRFTFLEKDTTGFSWGYDLRDAEGIQWSAKYGPEAQSEVVASRIVWALGYHQPHVYYVDDWHLVGGDRPGPGIASRFRPMPPTMRRGANWSWYENPFVGTPEFRRLLVLMRVLNNWDLRHQNNYVYEVETPRGPARWYVVQDLGAAFGKTRLVPDPGTRNDPEDFEEQGFIKGVDADGVVRFDDLGRHDRRLYGAVTVDDVKWVGSRLDRLSPAQWRDAFRAARYEEAVADRFIRRLQEKVRAGLILDDPPPRAARTRD